MIKGYIESLTYSKTDDGDYIVKFRYRGNVNRDGLEEMIGIFCQHVKNSNGGFVVSIGDETATFEIDNINK